MLANCEDDSSRFLSLSSAVRLLHKN